MKKNENVYGFGDFSQFLFCRDEPNSAQGNVEKAVGLGRPGSRLSGLSFIDSFSQSTGNNQPLRPLSVTPSIGDPLESSWPLLSSTPSPAWSGPITNTLGTDDMGHQISNQHSSTQLPNHTTIPTSLIPRILNSPMPSNAISNRPIGADVLLSSSSSVASQIQEQMSQSLRQKSLMNSQISLPEREAPITASNVSLDSSSGALSVSLPLNFRGTEPTPTQIRILPFKPTTQAGSVQSTILQTPVQVPIGQELPRIGTHCSVATTSICHSDIKTLPLQPTATLKLVEADPLPSNQFLQPICHLRDQNMLKGVNTMNNKPNENLNISTMPTIIPKVQNIPVSSLELPLQPVRILSQGNHNSSNNPALVGPLKLANDGCSVPYSVSTPGTGVLNVIKTFPVVPETGLTIFPSINTPKMSLITLENSNKVEQPNQNLNYHPGPTLRRVFNKTSAEPLVVGGISDTNALDLQIIHPKIKSFENLNFASSPSLNQDQNVKLLLSNNPSYINTNQNKSNVNFVPCVEEVKEKQEMSSTVTDHTSPSRIPKQNEGTNRNVLQPIGRVHILPSVSEPIQNELIQTAVSLNPHKIPNKTNEQLIKIQQPTPISISSQTLANPDKTTLVTKIIDPMIPKNIVQSTHLASSANSGTDVCYAKCTHPRKNIQQEPNGFAYVVDSVPTRANPKQQYVQIKNAPTKPQIQYKDGESHSLPNTIEITKALKGIDTYLEKHDVTTPTGSERKSHPTVFSKLSNKPQNSNALFLDNDKLDLTLVCDKEEPIDTYIEKVICCKCRICGYLNTSSRRINDHLESEHLDLLDESALFSISSEMRPILTNWSNVAQKQRIPLRCSLCMNTFQGVYLSFKIHLMDDHGLDENDTNKYFEAQNEKRRIETLEHVKKRKYDIEKQRGDKREILEAYLDEKGELRVRTAKRYIAHAFNEGKETRNILNSNVEELAKDEENVDVSAKEYMEAVKVARNLESANSSKNHTHETISTNKDQKRLIALTKSSIEKLLKTNSVNSKKKSNTRGECRAIKTKLVQKTARLAGSKNMIAKKNTNSDERSKITEEERIQPIVTTKMKRTVGRPKGSRTIGLTKLKRVNPQIQMNDKEMGGTECGLDGCAVRFKDKDKLDYHRKCHNKENNQECAIYRCPECIQEKSSITQNDEVSIKIYNAESWKSLALHLWRVHKVDMELYSCDICHEFKEFTSWRLEAHKITHQVERPFLCNECGKCFKTHRNLKMHSHLHEDKNLSAAKNLDALNKKSVSPNKAGVCASCNKGFTTLRFLRHHVETVHKGLRPFMCNFCG